MIKDDAWPQLLLATRISLSGRASAAPWQMPHLTMNHGATGMLPKIRRPATTNPGNRSLKELAAANGLRTGGGSQITRAKLPAQRLPLLDGPTTNGAPVAGMSLLLPNGVSTVGAARRGMRAACRRMRAEGVQPAQPRPPAAKPRHGQLRWGLGARLLVHGVLLCDWCLLHPSQNKVLPLLGHRLPRLWTSEAPLLGWLRRGSPTPR